jgi:hypothetical protein
MVKDTEATADVLQRQHVNSHTIYVLLMLGLGSMSYGYNASIIGTTQGKAFGQPKFLKPPH